MFQRGLRGGSPRGVKAEHVLDLQLAQEVDGELWRRAAETSAVIVSKDEDFAVLARGSQAGPSVIWLRTGNGTTRDLIGFLEPLWPAVEDRIRGGDRLIEAR
jgi:predicted nuclease of predicted toxin-antitoxin system